MAGKKAKPRTLNKSSVTGRFVSDKEMAKKPRETYKQTVRKDTRKGR